MQTEVLRGEAEPSPFWTRAADAVTADLSCGRDGLTTTEAMRRRDVYGPNGDAPSSSESFARAILRLDAAGL